MNPRISRLVIASSIALVATTARAEAPAFIPVQGELANADGTPVDGPVEVRFAFYDASSGGTALWEETQTVTVNDGFFDVFLGTVTPLAPTLFRDSSPLHLSVKVGTDTEEMRFPLGLAPYAGFAELCGDAAALGGRVASTFARADHAHGFGQLTDVPEGLADGDDDTTYDGVAPIEVANGQISLASCSTGQVLKWDGKAWTCAVDIRGSAGSFTGDSPIEVDGTTVRLASTACSPNAVWKWSGTEWACSEDADTLYTGAGAIDVSGASISLSTSGCVQGEVWKWNGSSWSCEDDDGANYTGANGVTVNGASIELSTSGCSAGFVWKRTSNGWACQADADTTYSGTGAVAVNGTSLNLSTVGCADGYVWKYVASSQTWACQADATGGGGGSYSAVSPVSLDNTGTKFGFSTTNCPNNGVWKYKSSSSTWACEADTDTNTTYAATAPIAITGANNAISLTGALSGAGCTANQVPKWNATTSVWACASDTDTNTTYDATSPITLDPLTNKFGLSSTNCQAGYVWKYNGNNTWSCQADNGQVYSQSSPITISAGTIGLMQCASNEILKFNNGAWGCNTDNGGSGTSYTAAAPIDVSAQGQFSLRSAGCPSNGVWKWSSTSGWGCSADSNTTYTAASGSGVSVGASTIGLTTCAQGQVLKAGATAGTWSCAADTDTTTTYTAATNGGVAVVGTTVGLIRSCAGGQTLKWNGTSSAWECGSDVGAIYSGTAPVNVSGTTVSLSGSGCTNNQVLKWNSTTSAWACANDVDTNTTYTAGSGIGISGTTVSLSTTNCVDGEVWKRVNGTWDCVPDAAGTTYTVAEPLVVSGGSQIKLGPTTPCAANQVLKWSGTVWECRADNDTTYTGSSPISVASGQVSLNACPNGQVLKYQTTAPAGWRCQADNVGTYGQGNGILISAGNNISVDTAVIQARVSEPCSAAGDFMTAVDVDGLASCEDVFGQMGDESTRDAALHRSASGRYHNAKGFDPGNHNAIDATTGVFLESSSSTYDNGYGSGGLYVDGDTSAIWSRPLKTVTPRGQRERMNAIFSIYDSNNLCNNTGGGTGGCDDPGPEFVFGSGAFASYAIGTYTGAYLTTGGTWENPSDFTKKENFTAVDSASVLDAIASMPILEWNYIAESDDVRHVGPSAQDFHAAFGLGHGATTIATVDADGIALTAIQELAKRNEALRETNEALSEKVDALEARLAALERLLTKPVKLP